MRAQSRRRRVGSRRVRPVLFPSTKQSRLVFLAVSRAVCLSRRLREQKNLFTSIQGIHKTRRLIIKTLQNLTCPDEKSSAQPIKGCCLRGGQLVSKAVHYYFFLFCLKIPGHRCTQNIHAIILASAVQKFGLGFESPTRASAMEPRRALCY